MADKENGSSAEYQGAVEGILYRNDDSGYTVFTFVSENGDLISAVGTLPDVGEGDKLTIRGKWEMNLKYGKQLRVMQYTLEQISGVEDIERYLASGAVKGVGPKTARKIVDIFGEDTADVIENHADWLARIPGINLRRAREISAEYKSKADIRAAMTFFGEYFSPSLTMRIYNKFGGAAIDAAKKDPFRLCDEIDGISFEKADQLASKLGLDPSSDARLEAGCACVLQYNARQNGHTCLPYDKLVKAAADMLGVEPDLVAAALRRKLKLGRLVSEKNGEEELVYDRATYNDEKYIAEKLVRLLRGGVAINFADIDGFIRMEEARRGVRYADEQKKAIFAALTGGAVVLTGGPGTGKTTVVSALIDIFESMDMEVVLAAPTGRAAKRITEATVREAKTVHRLLEADFDGAETRTQRGESRNMRFRRDENNHLDENVIIIDEASMLDTALTASLLRAIKPGARLILIGDSDQLPSVGAGNVLGDIIRSGAVPCIALTQIFRQAESSLIVTNAHAINRGNMPRLDVKNSDFFFLPRNTDAEIRDTITDLCASRLPNAYGSDETVQVIAPSRKGVSGTESLNLYIRSRVNPHSADKKEYKNRDTVYRVGDRVMQVRNNYELEWSKGQKSGRGVFNGDIGVIRDVNPSTRSMDVDFDGRTVDYAFSDLEDLELAYAVTVHKSQGSEYSTVVIPVGNVPPALCIRNLLYTAVTRAKNRVILVGREETVRAMTQNKRATLRYTGLASRLVALTKPR